MSDFYTNHYKTAPNADVGTKPAYAGPIASRSDEVTSLYSTFTNDGTFGNSVGDVLHIAPLPTNAKVLRFSAKARTDLDTNNDFTFDLGTTAAPAAFLAASNGLQAAAEVALAPGVLYAAAKAVRGDELILTRAGGSLEAAGTIDVFVEYVVTQL